MPPALSPQECQLPPQEHLVLLGGEGLVLIPLSRHLKLGGWNPLELSVPHLCLTPHLALTPLSPPRAPHT